MYLFQILEIKLIKYFLLHFLEKCFTELEKLSEIPTIQPNWI